MSDQDPRPDIVPDPPPYTAAPVSPAATAYGAAVVAPAEPETMPELAAPASFTVPQEPEEPAPSDKLWLHFAWEGLLLVLIALGVAAFFLFGPSGGLGSPDRVAELLSGATPFLLFAMALGLSMRVGAVNLAVVHLGLLSTFLFGILGNEPLPVAIGIVAGAMVAAGVLLSLLVTVFKAPGWVASLLVAMAAWFLVTQRELDIFGALTSDPARPTQVELTPLVGWIVVAVVIGLSIGGGLIGIMRPVRETLGVCVDAVEQRRGRTVGAFATTWVALIGSCLLAGAAGYLVMLPSGANLSVAVVEANGLAPVLTSLGIVLIGGTSARGRRGGVFGTLLAAVAVFMAALLLENLDGTWIVNYAIPFGVLLLGLLVNWIMDLANRPRKYYLPTFAPAAAAPVFVAPNDSPSSPAYGAGEPVDGTVYATSESDAYASPAPDGETSAYVAAEPPVEVPPPYGTAEPGVEIPPVYGTVPEPAIEPTSILPAEKASSHSEPPTAVDTTHEIPAAESNPYLYRPPSG